MVNTTAALLLLSVKELKGFKNLYIHYKKVNETRNAYKLWTSLVSHPFQLTGYIIYLQTLWLVYSSIRTSFKAPFPFTQLSQYIILFFFPIKSNRTTYPYPSLGLRASLPDCIWGTCWVELICHRNVRFALFVRDHLFQLHPVTIILTQWAKEQDKLYGLCL